MSNLKVIVEHGDQCVEFDSPGEEGVNSGLPPDADFGGILDVVAKPFKAIVGVATKATGAVAVLGVTGVERFARTAATAAGRTSHSLLKYANKAAGTIKAAAGKIPAVGKPLATVVGMTTEPVRFADALASGKRVDRVALDSLKKNVAATIALAPYAQMVSATIPGVGTGVAAGIAAGAALAEGRTVNEAAVAAARAAIPGGPLAKAAFDGAVAVASGRSVSDSVTASAISLAARTPAERAQLSAALEIAGGASGGRPIGDVALRAAVASANPKARPALEKAIGKPGAQTSAYDALVAAATPEVKRALTSGLAVGHAKMRQKQLHAAITSPAARGALTKAGRSAVAGSAVLRAAQRTVPDAAAFELGIGLMLHSGVTPPTVLYLRDVLPVGRSRVSYDAALAMQIGAASSPAFLAKVSNARKVGYYAVAGSLSGTPAMRRALVKLMAKNAEGRAGAATAVKVIRRHRSLWRRLVAWLRGRE